MKIAILSTVAEYVPPRGYGGTELVVSNLTEKLVELGHDVTLFSAEGAKTKAKNITNGRQPSYHDDTMSFDDAQKILDQKFLESQDQFDIVHAHTSHRFFNISDQVKIPKVLTVHTMFRDQWKDLYLKNKNVPVVSISKSQAELSGLDINFISTVYNGIDISLFDFEENPKDHMAWIGRIVRSKGTLEAIEIAKQVKQKLKIAGRFISDTDDDKKYEEEVREAMKDPLIEYVGEVSTENKNEFLANAKMLINPIQWPEPFGLVIPEANACGTPSIAYSIGAMPELIENGKNGFAIKLNDKEEFIQKIKDIFSMEDVQYKEMRKNSRKIVEERFSVERMTDDYIKVYEKVLSLQAK